MSRNTFLKTIALAFVVNFLILYIGNLHDIAFNPSSTADFTNRYWDFLGIATVTALILTVIMAVIIILWVGGVAILRSGKD